MLDMKNVVHDVALKKEHVALTCRHGQCTHAHADTALPEPCCRGKDCAGRGRVRFSLTQRKCLKRLNAPPFTTLKALEFTASGSAAILRSPLMYGARAEAPAWPVHNAQEGHNLSGRVCHHTASEPHASRWQSVGDLPVFTIVETRSQPRRNALIRKEAQITIALVDGRSQRLAKA